ncbi:hypothetical protein ACU4HD_12070 [Cupriavidus basilensis]
MMRWTAEEEAKLRELWVTGQSFRVIGAHLGRAGDAVYRKGREMGLGSKPLATERSPTWVMIQRIAADGVPRTVHEFASLTGAARHTIDCLFKKRAGMGEAHIARWRKRQGTPIPHWLPTAGKDAQRPVVPSIAERARRLRARMREEDPIAYRAMLSRNSLRRSIKTGALARRSKAPMSVFSVANEGVA